MQLPLTDSAWKHHLGGFFNVATGPFRAGQRYYGGFTAQSDAPDFEHPAKIYAEYEAVDESKALATGTLRLWDFSKAETRFQTEEGRAEIAGRERDVISYIRDRSEDCEAAILVQKAQDADRSVAFWEVYDRRKRLKRMTTFVPTEVPGLSRETKIDLSRQLIAKVANLHSIDAAHLDIGAHSIWLQAPSTVKLSHFMAASYPQVQSLGETRYQFLASARVPEDAFGGALDGKRKDVFLLGVSVHHLLFGQVPKSDSPDMPPEWLADVDAEGIFADLHPWFESALALVPSDRFIDASAALAAFNAATASKPSTMEVIQGLERYRTTIRTQMQLFAAAPPIETIREDDRVAIWRSAQNGEDVVVKMWKRAAWRDQARDGPRILDFLMRAQNMLQSPAPHCAAIRDVLWLSDAFVLIQEDVGGANLADSVIASDHAWSDGPTVLNFLKKLTEAVIALHNSGLAHGDLKPHNIVVSDRDGAREPVLVDVMEFSLDGDGELKSSAYAPAVGGSYERDRFAVTKIAEERLGSCDLEPGEAADVARAIDLCRNSAPENGTLLPLLEAINRVLSPVLLDPRTPIRLSIRQAKAGPILADEGVFYLRRGFGRSSLILRGACEEVEIFFDNTARPVNGRRREIEQKLIAFVSRHEFMSLPLDVEINRSDCNDFSGLDRLFANPDFIEAWAQVLEVLPQREPEDDPLASEEQSDERAEDALFEAIASEPPPTGQIDIGQLWRKLIDAERDLTTDGVAAAESSYRHDIKRHVAPFEIESGTFDFNREDRVLVRRADRRGNWPAIGHLDIHQSRPDLVVIDPSSWGTPAQARVVNEGQRLRFESHFEATSLKRRELAVSRLLSGCPAPSV